MDPNCLPRLSADDTGRQRVNHHRKFNTSFLVNGTITVNQLIFAAIYFCVFVLMGIFTAFYFTAEQDFATTIMVNFDVIYFHKFLFLLENHENKIARENKLGCCNPDGLQ